LLVDATDASVPLFDTTRVHAQDAVIQALISAAKSHPIRAGISFLTHPFVTASALDEPVQREQLFCGCGRPPHTISRTF
jgi:hypothetical protein